MNRSVRLFTILAITLFTFSSANAQKASYTTNSGLTIGFGLGASYQQSDIANSFGAGFDFQFGSHLYHREGAFLDVDWKFRFLAGENIAHDHRINPDLSYSNIRYRHYDYDLELGLTLNRLRERTRIVITGFAGAGITHGLTFTDLLDSNGDPYDYSVIDPAGTRTEVVAALVNLSDLEYETALDNRAAILPTAGIYLGYQFSRSFSIGIEHKVNFSLSESGGTFGMNMDNIVVSGSPIDMNHYTSIGFRWSIRGGRSGRSNVSSYPEVTKAPVVYNNPVRPVVVERTSTPVRRDTTRDFRTRPPLSTRNLTTGGQVTTNPVTVNQVSTGQEVNNQVSNIQETRPVSTRPTGVTSTTKQAPTIRFINPPSPITVDRNVYFMKAETSNINAWQDVEVKVNGIPNSSFSFAPNGVVTLNMALREGENRIIITGKNEAGTSSETTTISYVKAVAVVDPVTVDPVTVDPVTVNPITVNPVTDQPCPGPVISMTAPARPGTTTQTASYTFRTAVSNIKEKSEINIIFNGRAVSSFNLSRNEVSYTATLQEGLNTLVVTADNYCGSKTVNSSISYVPEVVVVAEPCSPPTVSFTLNETNSGNTTHQMRGRVTNVKDRNAISVSVNGSVFSNFSFVAATGDIRADFSFSEGSSTVVVRVSNDCGENSASRSVTIARQESACGPRINPGNAAWQFCLVTPSGTINRNNLQDNNFSYSGSASSLFFMPIAGGGNAIVNGKPYTIRPGQYYLFTGNLSVKVSTSNPGSMGHWSVCITADRAPVSGNGNNRPKSPCETTGTGKK